MMIQQSVQQNHIKGLSVSDTFEGLRAIQNNDCAAALWHCQPTSEFQSWIDGLDPGLLPSARAVTRVDMMQPVIQNTR